MRHYLYLLTLLTNLIFISAAQAQDRAWVQIEARPTLNQAQERARAYSAAFPDVAGFRLNSGWYAIALGPYSPEAALARLAQLRADNLIPSDSFIAGGEAYSGAFWPVGQDPSTAPVTGITETVLAPLTPSAPTAEPEPQTIAEPAPVMEPVETVAEARRAESALTREERMDLQDALKWFGFYQSALDGAFGRGTRASMAAWQEANGYEPTGVMTTKQRAGILAERNRIVAELGLRAVNEEEAGIEITLPLALINFDHYEPPFVHFSEANNSGIRAVLISQPGDRATLSGLYDILQTLEAVPRTGERSIDDQSFTINAENGTIASYAHAELSKGLVKGYMLIWTPQAAEQAAHALKAMQASFTPVGKRALDPGLVSLDEAQRRSLLAGMEVRRPILSRSGFFVTPQGAVLTSSEAVQGCGRITLDRATEADVTFEDRALGLALLTPRSPLAPRHFAGFNTTAPRIGTEIAVAGYPYEDALPSPTLTFGAFEDGKGLAGEPDRNRLSLTALPGDAGGPVIDGTGAVLGMLLPRDSDSGRLLPPEVSFLAASSNIMARLSEGGLATQLATRAGALAPEDLTEMATSMTVLVSCWE